MLLVCGRYLVGMWSLPGWCVVDKVGWSVVGKGSWYVVSKEGDMVGEWSVVLFVSVGVCLKCKMNH